MAIKKCFICLTRIDSCESSKEGLTKESDDIENTRNDKADYGILVDVFSKYLQVEFKEKDVLSLELERNGKHIQLCNCCCIVASESIRVVHQLESLQENLNQLLAKIVSCIIESEKVQPQLLDHLRVETDDHIVDINANQMQSIHSIRRTLIQNFDAKVQLTSCNPRRASRFKSGKKIVQSKSINAITNSASTTVETISECQPEEESFSFVLVDVNFPTLEVSQSNHSQSECTLEGEKYTSGDWELQDKLLEIEDDVNYLEVEEETPPPPIRSKSMVVLSNAKRLSTAFGSNSTREIRKQNHAKQVGEGKYIYQGYEFSALEKETGYQCGTCSVSCTGSTRNRENIMLHLKRCHINEGKFPCEICGKAFGTGKELRRHGIVHETLRTHMCELCGKTFKMPYQLQLHMKRHENMQCYECHICKKKVTTVYSLQNHIKRVHEGVRDFQCDKCLFKFTSSSSLKRHLRGHERDSQATQNCNLNLVDRPFQCELCGARLATKYSLNYHMLTVHAASKNFACSICDKKFKTRKALRRHAVCHSDEYDYMCTICGLRLKRARSLKLHMMTHEGIKRFECEICNAKFAYDQGRKIHIATVHEGQKNYECKICFKKFGTPQSLARHNLVHTGERKYICETCGNKYQQSNVLKRHIQEVHLKMKPRPRKSCKKAQSSNEIQQAISGSTSALHENLDFGAEESDSSTEEEEMNEVHPTNSSSRDQKSVFGELGMGKLDSLTPVQFDSQYMSDTLDYPNPIFYNPPGRKLD